MKIALVSPYDYGYPGGVNAHVRQLQSNFLCLGHEAVVIASSSGSSLPPANGKTILLGRPVPIPTGGSIARIALSPRLAGPVKEMLAEEKFDIVHLHEPLLPALPITVLRFSSAINVGTFHAYHDSHRGYGYGKPILKRWFRRLHGKIAVSRPAMEFVQHYFPGYYNIIPNGIDYERFSQETAPMPDFRDGKLNILFVGRLEKRKGLKYLMQAFEFIKREFPQARLIVVGPAGGALPIYQKFVAERGLEDVAFVGRVSEDDLPRYYAAADVFCAPATGNESFGIVLLEAMASGRPVVASNIEGYASVIPSREVGILVEPESVESLVGALSHLLADASLRQRMGEAGRRHARQYSWDLVAQKVLSYYQRILSEKPTPYPPEPDEALVEAS
ncbi:MAG: glycosyltransferase family 4 protein [Chloroflexi bacterium]|nr:glycosyltransferase family 4 protein [Chloroflexota bacterium]